MRFGVTITDVEPHQYPEPEPTSGPPRVGDQCDELAARRDTVGAVARLSERLGPERVALLEEQLAREASTITRKVDTVDDGVAQVLNRGDLRARCWAKALTLRARRALWLDALAAQHHAPEPDTFALHVVPAPLVDVPSFDHDRARARHARPSFALIEDAIRRHGPPALPSWAVAA